MATDLEPKDPVLKPGMTRDELAAALGVGSIRECLHDGGRPTTPIKPKQI